MLRGLDIKRPLELEMDHCHAHDDEDKSKVESEDSDASDQFHSEESSESTGSEEEL